MDPIPNREELVTEANIFRKVGNLSFKKNGYFEALSNYNQSLITAKLLESEELLAFAYGNRSAVYFKIKQYEKCLKNIQLARLNGYPADKLHKLQSREEKCHEMMQQQQEDPGDDPNDFFKLTYPVNKKIPFIVDCLEIREGDKRGIFTNRDLKAGDIIAIEESFFTFTGNYYLQCSTCTKMDMLNLIPGDAEKMFCSNECRNEYEQRTARYNILSRDSLFDNLKKALDITGGYRELSRIYADTTKRTVFDYDFSKPNDETTKLNMLKCVVSLEKYQLEEACDASKSLKIVSRILKEKLKSVKMSRRNKKIIIEFSRRNYLISWYYMFLYSGLSASIPIFLPLVNHSCDPNIDIVTVKGRLVAVVNRPLLAGDQIFLSTNSRFDSIPKSERQCILFRLRRLHCDCIACVEDYPLYDGLSHRDLNFKLPIEGFGSVKETTEELKTNWNYLTENMKIHPSFETNTLLRRNRKLIDHMKNIVDRPF